MKFYLAGPFFNKPQLDLIQQIELLFCDAGIACFSPRTAHSDKTKTEIRTLEQAKAVFKSNVDNINDCTHMLAVIDWLLPNGEAIRKCYDGIPGVSIGNASEPLNLPDSGTVWEMGYAFGSIHIPIILFRTNPVKLNLMLAQCSTGIITGLDQLKRFLVKKGTNRPNWDEASSVADIMKQNSLT